MTVCCTGRPTRWETLENVQMRCCERPLCAAQRGGEKVEVGGEGEKERTTYWGRRIDI